MATYSTESAKRANTPYWWVEIEGIKYRYGSLKDGTDTVFDGWNPADTGNNRHIKEHLATAPTIGGQEVDPVNGECDIPSHSFTLFDHDDEITSLLSVSDSSQVMTRLTQTLTAAQSTIPVDDVTDFGASGVIYIDRETITYAATNTDSSVGESAAYAATGKTPEPGHATAHSIQENSGYFVEQGDGYMVGAKITFTAGGNSGESRIITASHFDSTTSHEVFEWDTPMPNAFDDDGTDDYSISTPPNQIRCTALTEAADYWNGAVVYITSGENSGIETYVEDFDATNDVLILHTPLPHPMASGDTFSIYLAQLTGCGRGAFGSTAAAHSIVDENNTVIPRMVYSKAPFIKTRSVKIYQSYTGLLEADAVVAAHGFIDDYYLINGMTCYKFECSGLSKILTKKLMNKQAKASIYDTVLWGGAFSIYPTVRTRMVGSGSTAYAELYYDWSIGYSVSSGVLNYATFNRICIGYNSNLPDDGGNIIVGDEIIHYIDTVYDRKSYGLSLSGIAYLCLRLTDDDIDINQEIYRTATDAMVIADSLLKPRGLFFAQLGIGKTNKVSVSEMGFDKKGTFVGVDNSQFVGKATSDAFVYEDGSADYPKLNINALVTEHAPGEEILLCCMCENSTWSDFPRYDRVPYTVVAGSIAVGESLTGGTSGCTGWLMEKDATYGFFLVASRSTYQWSAGETITGSGGGTVTVGSTDLQNAVRPRNNVIDVVLQLLTSTGIKAANGAYDTLPEGFGLGIDDSLIDIDGIEILRDKYFANLTINFCLTEPVSAKEWLQENVFTLAQIFPFETYDGKISLGCLMTYEEAQVQDSLTTLTHFNSDHLEARILPDWTSGKEPITKIILKYNKDPGQDVFYGTTNVFFDNSAEWYQDRGRTIEIENAVLYHPDPTLTRISHRDVKLPAILKRFLSVLWDRQALYPCPVLQLTTPFSDVAVDIGDIVKVTDTNIPNMRTSARGLSSEYHQIVGKEYQPGEMGIPEKITWKLWQIGVHDNKYGRRCPSANVTAHANVLGKSRITVSSRKYSKIGEQDISYFAVGDEVQFLQDDYESAVDPPPHGTIYSIDSGNNYVYLTTLLATVPASGWIMEYAPYDSCTSTQQDTHTFMSGNDHVLGAAADNAYKWM